MHGFDDAQRLDQLTRTEFGTNLYDGAHGVRPVEVADMVERRNTFDLVTGNAVYGDDGLAE